VFYLYVHGSSVEYNYWRLSSLTNYNLPFL
jgi:hypothetical protein